MKMLLSLCLIFALVSAESREVSNEDIINEINHGPAYEPNRFLLNVKPISFIVGQALGDKLPYPMKCIQAKVRLFSSLGLQVEPVFVVGGDGGYGFTVGPAYFPKYPWEEWHIGPKYELDYIQGEGAFHGLMLEFDRHRRWGHFVLTYGGAVGFGVSGVKGSEDFEGNMRILEVEQGITFDINLGLGFAL